MTEPIWRAALELARPRDAGQADPPARRRGVGLRARASSSGLFEAEDERRRRVVEAADELRERFGTRAVTRARLLRTGIPAPFERDLGTAGRAARLTSRRIVEADAGANSGREAPSRDSAS